MKSERVASKSVWFGMERPIYYHMKYKPDLDYKLYQRENLKEKTLFFLSWWDKFPQLFIELFCANSLLSTVATMLVPLWFCHLFSSNTCNHWVFSHINNHYFEHRSFGIQLRYYVLHISETMRISSRITKTCIK